MSWLKESNRAYHVGIGFGCAIIGTIIGAAIAAVCLEGKDCQGDADNAGKPVHEWTWSAWDWKDFLATLIGGFVGQAVQVGVILLILMLL